MFWLGAALALVALLVSRHNVSPIAEPPAEPPPGGGGGGVRIKSARLEYRSKKTAAGYSLGELVEQTLTLSIGQEKQLGFIGTNVLAIGGGKFKIDASGAYSFSGTMTHFYKKYKANWNGVINPGDTVKLAENTVTIYLVSDTGYIYLIADSI